jgi:hypothetical protein
MSWLKNLFSGRRARESDRDPIDALHARFENILEETRANEATGFVDLRPESERNMERKAQSRLSAEDEEIAQRMVSLIQQCQSLDDAAAQEMKKIGEQICADGGNDRMLLIAYRVQALGRRVRDCELYWDGICGWMY